MGEAETVDKARENRLRRHAQRLGLLLRKSRARHLHRDNFGGYMLVDAQQNAVVEGSRYELDFADVQDYLQAYESQLRASVRDSTKAQDREIATR